MSWLEKIQNELIITTGDGKEYRPSWLNASKQIEYNTAEFTFPNLSGTLVKRGTPIGTKYALEIYFQGDDHLDNSLAFEKSAADNRPWTVDHPFYGTLTIQPTALSFDNTAYNISKITGSIIETILEDNPKTTIDPIDQIKIAKTNIDVSFEDALSETPSSTDINTMTAFNDDSRSRGVKIIEIPSEAEDYFNFYNDAASAINTAIASPLLAMRAIITVITAPANFTVNVKSRINLLVDQFNLLRDNLDGLLNVSSKQIYQNQGGTIISSMALAAATPLDTDYANSNSVLNIIDLIKDTYDQYIEDLDTLQNDNGGNPLYYIPDATSLIALNSLVNLTTSSLFNIALKSKSERSIIMESDTNIIILTHRLYGLDAADANIDELIANNSLGLSSLLQVKKNTRIVYYI